MVDSGSLSHCAEEVRRYDRDRFLTALFAAGERREGLFALYAFNLEVSKVREVVSEPTLGAIRLQWWREALDEIYGDRPVRRHAVAEALGEAVRKHALSRNYFDTLIDTRLQDLEETTPKDIAELEHYAVGTSASLVCLALETLGAEFDKSVRDAGRSVGIAWAIVGLIRAMPHHLRQGRFFLPGDLEARHQVDRRAMLDLKPSVELAAAVAELASVATTHLEAARARRGKVPKHALAALLPGVLADGYLRRLARVRYDVFDPRLAERPGLASARLAFRALTGRY